MISCFVATYIPINRKHFTKAKGVKCLVRDTYRVCVCMSQSNEQQSSKPETVSQNGEGSQYRNKKTGESDSSERVQEGRTGGSFKYIPGAQGKIDVWFIIGLLIFVIPIVAIVWGLSTGVIDLSSS